MINDESLQNIEKLHKLKSDGVISEEEFAEAKRDLLQGKTTSKQGPKTPLTARDPLNPSNSDWIGWIMLPLRRYAEFEGRSRRKEWWMFQLTYVALFIVAGLFAAVSPDLGIVVFIVGALALALPNIAATARRFHDQDKSGWFTLFYLLPYVGAFIILIFMLIPGTNGPNQFGDDPID